MNASKKSLDFIGVYLRVSAVNYGFKK